MDNELRRATTRARKNKEDIPERDGIFSWFHGVMD